MAPFTQNVSLFWHGCENAIECPYAFASGVEWETEEVMVRKLGRNLMMKLKTSRDGTYVCDKEIERQKEEAGIMLHDTGSVWAR